MTNTIFITGLTIYTYQNEFRKMLNIQEAKKFDAALDVVREHNVHRYHILSPYTLEELEENMNMMDRPEFDIYSKFVINPIKKIMDKKDDRNIIKKVDLMDFEKVSNMVHRILNDHLDHTNLQHSKKEKWVVYLNTSCGHKIGSLAMYVAALNVANGHKEDMALNPFHIEENIKSPLPNANIEISNPKIDREKYLELYAEPISHMDAKREIIRDVSDEREVDKRIAYFKN
jgi:hypothetical protein